MRPGITFLIIMYEKKTLALRGHVLVGIWLQWSDVTILHRPLLIAGSEIQGDNDTLPSKVEAELVMAPYLTLSPVE